MIFEPIYFESSYRNFGYLIGNRSSGEAIIVDPFRADEVEAALERLKVRLIGIVTPTAIGTTLAETMLWSKRTTVESWPMKTLKPPAKQTS